MLLGELSKKAGLSKDTIRFYEKMGLIAASDRQAGTRLYKEYGVADYLTKQFVIKEYSAGNEDNTVACLQYQDLRSWTIFGGAERPQKSSNHWVFRGQCVSPEYLQSLYAEDTR